MAFDERLEFEDPSRTTQYLLANAFAAVAFTYLASVSSLNRWRALQEYDAHVSLEESPRLKPKNDIPRPDSKKLRLQIISSVLFGLVGSAVLFGIMYFFMEKDMNLAARIILGLPIFCLAYIGYSQLTVLLMEEQCLRVVTTTVKGALLSAPVFITASPSKNTSFAHRVFFSVLALYPTISPNPYNCSLVTYGTALAIIKHPYSRKSADPISIRVWTIITLICELVFVPLILSLVISSYREKDESPYRIATAVPHIVFFQQGVIQYIGLLSGGLTSTILRYEWSAAPASLKSSTVNELSIEERESREIGLPLQPSFSRLNTPSPYIQGDDAEHSVKVVRLPPTLSPFPERTTTMPAWKPSFPTPLFNLLLLTAFIVHLPSIVLSLPSLSYLRTSPSISPTTSFAVAFLIRFPAEFWSLILVPLVFAVYMGCKWAMSTDPSEREALMECWDYKEAWVKTIPGLTQVFAIRVQNVVEVHRDVEGDPVEGVEGESVPLITPSRR